MAAHSEKSKDNMKNDSIVEIKVSKKSKNNAQNLNKNKRLTINKSSDWCRRPGPTLKLILMILSSRRHLVIAWLTENTSSNKLTFSSKQNNQIHLKLLSNQFQPIQKMQTQWRDRNLNSKELRFTREWKLRIIQKALKLRLHRFVNQLIRPKMKKAKNNMLDIGSQGSLIKSQLCISQQNKLKNQTLFKRLTRK